MGAHQGQHPMPTDDELSEALEELQDELEALKGMLKVAYDTDKVVLQKLVLQRVHQIGESVKRRRDELRKFMESIGATNGRRP
jgi:hypothetical protein